MKGTAANFDQTVLAEFLGAKPSSSSTDNLLYTVLHEKKSLTFEVSQDGCSAIVTLADSMGEYSSIKLAGVGLFDFSPKSPSLTLEGEDKGGTGSFQVQLTVRPQIELHSHIRIVNDSTIVDGINWQILEHLPGVVEQLHPSGSATFSINDETNRRLLLEIGEDRWSASISALFDNERIASSTIEEVQYFNAAKDNMSLVLGTTTSASSCITRITLKPHASFSTNVQLGH